MMMHRPSMLIGVALGVGVSWAAREASWRPAHAPVDQRPLVIRHDDKGKGHFGAPRSGGLMHRGVDLVAALGSPVRAIRSGRVIVSGRHRGRGLYLELDHGRGLRSLYAHLQTATVRVGDRVRRGQAIGTVGKTGNARHPAITPHVHLEVSRHGELVDPASLGLVFVERTEDDTDGDAVGGD